MVCPNCRRKQKADRDYCSFCAASLRPDLPPLAPCLPHEWFATVGGWLLTIFLFVLCSPLLIGFVYGIIFVAPFYIGIMVWCAERNGRIYRTLCRLGRGKIPFQSWCGFAALAICLIAWGGILVYLDREREAGRQAIQAQYGPLYYPGALPDHDFSGYLRTSDSFGNVVRFYRGSPLCDDRKGWYGGGEYVTFCRRSAGGAAAKLHIYSRVENNEPYVMIGFD